MKRKLSIIEHLFWIGSLNRPENFAVSAHINGIFAIGQLYDALSKLKKRHSLLSVRVVLDENGKTYFSSVDVSDFSIREVIVHDNEDWHQEIEKELQRPFSWETGPLVRFVVLRSSDCLDLIVVCDHCVGDGLSSAYLIRDILRTIGKPESFPALLPELPGIEELIPTSFKEKVPLHFYLLRAVVAISVFTLAQIDKVLMSCKYIVNLLISLSSQKHVTGNISTENLKKEILSNETNGQALVHPKRNIFSWILSESETSILINRCKKEQTSVHAAICIAFLLASSNENVCKDQCQEQKVGTPVNIRNRLCYPIGEAFGLFTGRVETSFKYLPERNFWSMARAFKQRLKDNMKDDKIILPLLKLKILKPFIVDPNLNVYLFKILNFLEPKNKTYDVDISNLGLLDFPTQYDSLKLDAIYGPFVSTYECKDILGVATVGGKMSFSFVAMDLSKAKKITKNLVVYLKQAVC